MNLAKKLIPVLRNIKRSIFTNITKFGNLIEDKWIDLDDYFKGAPED